jgi:oligoribonuclease (3'-5' exoribonuclease)
MPSQVKVLVYIIGFLFPTLLLGQAHLFNALSEGNAQNVATHFHGNVELAIPGKEGNYSKAQAQQILLDFFLQQNVKKFELQHKGNSTEHSRYFIGTLFCQKAQFRVYGLFKEIQHIELLQILRFEATQPIR